MKYVLFLFSFLEALPCFAQPDSIRMIEPRRETSFDNLDLLVIAVLFFLVLVGLYFFYWRKRNR